MQDYRGAMKSLPNGRARSDGGGSVLTPVSKKSRISTPSLSGIQHSTKMSVCSFVFQAEQLLTIEVDQRWLELVRSLESQLQAYQIFYTQC